MVASGSQDRKIGKNLHGQPVCRIKLRPSINFRFSISEGGEEGGRGREGGRGGRRGKGREGGGGREKMHLKSFPKVFLFFISNEFFNKSLQF